VEHSDKTLVNFLRGHITEDLIAEALKAQGMKFVRQFDAKHPEKPYLRAHVDFLFGSLQNGRVSLMEVKSSTKIPEAPYESWVRQLAWQMALLDAMAPDAEIHGTVLCVDIAAAAFQTYPVMKARDIRPFMELMLQRGERLYQAMQGEIPFEALETEPGPLCQFCGCRSDCPAVQVDGDGIMDLSPITNLVHEYARLRDEINAAQKEQDRLRSEILGFMGETTTGRCNGYAVKWQVAQSRRFDTNRFKKVHPDLYEEFAAPTESVRLTITKEELLDSMRV